MLTSLNILTLVWLALWALRALKGLVGRERNAVFFPLIVLFFVNGLPLLLDEMISRPDYPDFWGLRIATRDEATAIIYCLYMLIVPPALWFVSGSPKPLAEGRIRRTNPADMLRPLQPILVFFLVSPFLALFFAPQASLYLSYAWVMTNLRAVPGHLEFHFYMMLLTHFCVLSAAALVAMARRLRWWYMVAVFTLVGGAVWLNGKRFILALAGILFWLVLSERFKLRKSTATVLALCLSLAVLTFSFAYQAEIRRVTSVSDVYENFRGDFGRDGVVKLTIFAELNPDRLQILEYRAQSFLFYATIPIPQSVWAEKPLPYSQYITAAALMTRSQRLGWGITSSWLEEPIANLGLLGFLIGPLIPALICRVGNKTPGPGVFPLTTLVSSLFLVLHFPAFIVICLMWLLIVTQFRVQRTVQRLFPRSQIGKARTSSLTKQPEARLTQFGKSDL